MTTFRELQKEINERKPGWVQRSSRRVDELLAGPRTPIPLAVWLGLWMLAFLFAGWFDG